MQSRVTNLVFCRSSDINNPVKFHEATGILTGCQVTEGTPLFDYNANLQFSIPKGHNRICYPELWFLSSATSPHATNATKFHHDTL